MTLHAPKLEHISPAKAEQYLNRNKANRSLREGRVEQYAHDMKTGRWTDCPVPISFYEDGDIADGQHRLYAIIESEKTVPFFVLHDLPREAGLNIDTGATRNVVDNARISGSDTELTTHIVAAAAFYEKGQRARNLTNADRLALAKKYRVPLQWAVSHGPKGPGMRGVAVVCAIARAFAAGVDEERLKQFCSVLSKGLSEGLQDSAAVALRNYIMSRTAPGSRKFAYGDENGLFLKTQNAIHYFIRRRTLNNIRTISEESYPLKKGGGR